MGGNAFGEARRLLHHEVIDIAPTIVESLSSIGLAETEFVGSTLKWPVVGDIDTASFATDNKWKTEIHKRFGAGNVTKCGETFCVKIPYSDSHIQLDVNVGNVKFMCWSMYAGTPQETNYKSSIRNVLLNTIYTTEANLIESADCTKRTRFCVDVHKGLQFLLQQRKAEQKKWTTLEKTFISDDPEQICSATFKCSVGETLTVETLIRMIKQRQKSNEILSAFRSNLLHFFSTRQQNELDAINRKLEETISAVNH